MTISRPAILISCSLLAGCGLPTYPQTSREEAIKLAEKACRPDGIGQDKAYTEYARGIPPKGAVWWVWWGPETDKPYSVQKYVVEVRDSTGQVEGGCDKILVTVTD
jgi:hypothetical protein